MGKSTRCFSFYSVYLGKIISELTICFRRRSVETRAIYINRISLSLTVFLIFPPLSFLPVWLYFSVTVIAGVGLIPPRQTPSCLPQSPGMITPEAPFCGQDKRRILGLGAVQASPPWPLSLGPVALWRRGRTLPVLSSVLCVSSSPSCSHPPSCPLAPTLPPGLSTQPHLLLLTWLFLEGAVEHFPLLALRVSPPFWGLRSTWEKKEWNPALKSSSR